MATTTLDTTHVATDDDAVALTIAEAAAASGLTVHTLRYYERDGLLLEPVARDRSGHRRYGERDLHWIEMLTRLRSTGMPIREVRTYAALVRSGGGEQERLELLESHRERVLAHLAEVQDHVRAIEGKIAVYRSAVGTC